MRRWLVVLVLCGLFGLAFWLYRRDRAPLPNRIEALRNLATIHHANADWPKQLPEMDAFTSDVQDAISQSGGTIAFIGELDDIQRTPSGAVIRFRCLHEGNDSIYFDLNARPDMMAQLPKGVSRGQTFVVVGSVACINRVDFQASATEADEGDSYTIELVSSAQTFIGSGVLVAAQRTT